MISVPTFRLGLSGCSGALESIASPQLLSLAQLTEDLGYNALWLNEEHFQGGGEFGRMCLSPIPLASAMLARTTRLRLGFSVLLLSLHQPLRLAEELATLDVLSGGRVDLGVSRGANPRYAAAFGCEKQSSDADLGTQIRFLQQAWGPSPVEIGGQPLMVQPKPVQTPHPPFYIATYTPEVAAWAGRMGHSLICHGITAPEVNDRLIAAFTDAGGAAAGIPYGRFVYVSDTDAAARAEVWPTVLALTARLRDIGINRRGVISADWLEPKTFFRQMMVVGSPQTCAEQIAAILARNGSCYFNGLAGFFGYLPFDRMLRSITLLARDTAPLLRGTR